ncbi:hypothetical protein E2562_032309 [Oryza meyeriana var. granulata]|uniref:Disease resistance N-terminal domain-containing protein n=1 Tax=Oryza meyeriana var. granulata TaxID=110450 RepID=A0A6G1ERW3_9ORYZ|nr:hypothetical protein E2562_032309 [Oryza meyeriana var. granulata]
MILDAFVPTLGRMVAEVVRERFDMLLGVAGEMKRLEDILEDLSNVLGDAERKRFADTAVEAWVRELKDDVLDVWRLEAATAADSSRHGPPPAPVTPTLPWLRRLRCRRVRRR